MSSQTYWIKKTAMHLNDHALSQKLGLPKVRGRYAFNVDLSKNVWFRVGGNAQVVFKPQDVADLQHFLQNKPKDLPVYLIGAGSNLLIRDGGVSGVVIRLTRGFNEITVNGTEMTAQAGALDRTVALMAANHGLAGLEFFAGIPGTIGGAVFMNAGAYGHETWKVLKSIDVVDAKGTFHTYTPDQIGYAYRHSNLAPGSIVVSATFYGKPASTAQILKRIDDIMQERSETQPVNARTGGSTFKNPPGKKAWELIDQAGCRGATLGGAQISEKHCNFLINTGHATACDLEGLGIYVQQQVYTRSAIQLEWEIQRIGIPTSLPEKDAWHA